MTYMQVTFDTDILRVFRARLNRQKRNGNAVLPVYKIYSSDKSTLSRFVKKSFL